MVDEIRARAAEFYRRVDEVINHITYKPGWKISIDPTGPTDYYGLNVYVTAVLRDASDGVRKPFMISKRLTVMPMDCPNLYIAREIGNIIRFAEDEQFKSWFKADGGRIYERYNDGMGMNGS